MRGESPEIWRSPIAYVVGGVLFCGLAGSAYLVTRAFVPGAAPAAVEVASSQGPMSLPAASAGSGVPRVEPSPPTAEPVPEVRIRTAPLPSPVPPEDEATPILAPEVQISDRKAEVQALIDGTSLPEKLPAPSGALPRSKYPEGSVVAPPQPRIPAAPATPATSRPEVIEVPSRSQPVPPVAPPPPVRARPRARMGEPRREEVRAPRGRLSLYFDADSSTFNRSGERMPLAVEVWVNGVLKLRSGDPEKRDFDLGRLPAGWHEVEVVPHVGDLPAQPRRRSVRIEEDDNVSYRVVLRREDGMACISKFKELD